MIIVDIRIQRATELSFLPFTPPQCSAGRSRPHRLDPTRRYRARPNRRQAPFTSTRDDKVPPGLAAETALDHTAAKPPSLSPDAVSVGFAVRSTLNWLVITTENVSLAAGQRRG
jgi:hypothetical protein